MYKNIKIKNVFSLQGTELSLNLRKQTVTICILVSF